MTTRFAATFAAFSGAVAVAAGAFGAHALKARLSPADLDIWETASRYQIYHALALLLVSRFIADGLQGSNLAAWGFIVGTLLFSGSLYLLVLLDQRWLGAITPLGGVALIAGWVALGIGFLRR